ncbi:hypothetical protein [Massilia rubra]|uniref:hypothetical protein n=1 Tax=Massilia rubra TaxID=2607910 RepID=UPI001422FB4E|nr:hypothetical protein [Massilia rubra]
MKKPAEAGFFTSLALVSDADRRPIATSRIARRKKTGPQAGLFQIVLISAQPMQQPKLRSMRQPKQQQQRQQQPKRPKRQLQQQ